MGTLGTTTSLSSGSALDWDRATVIADGRTVSAREAMSAGNPSKEMWSEAHAVHDWLIERGQLSVDIVASYDQAELPGAVMVRWGGPVRPDEVAERFGPIPCWMELRPDHTRDDAYLRCG